MKSPAGATYNRDEGPIYFIAANTTRVFEGAEVHPYVLIPLNELPSAATVEVLVRCLDIGARVILDSGIYWLATTHAKAHGLSMEQALAIAPEEIDGFNMLWDRFLELVGKYGDRCWGYIELDQGGRDNKVRMRTKLEGMGFKPIPVYHPLNDGWDYFDQLAKEYDRICYGNLVQAPANVRRQLLMTLWERRRAYPHLWVHLLGFTPNEWMLAMGGHHVSADSSVWLVPIRYPAGLSERALLKRVTRLGTEFNYVIGTEKDDPDYGPAKGTHMSGIACAAHQANWRHAVNRYAELGADLLPVKGDT